MRNISRILVVFLLVLGQRQSVLTQESHQVDHLVAFAKLSGDIQFFSPSDAANRLVWWRYCPRFVESVLGASDDRSFADTLIAIFQPIEPGLSIRYKDQALLAGDVAQEPKPLVVTTQHIGLDLWSGLYRRYRSIRTNRRSMTAAVDMSETWVTDIPIPADTLARSVSVSFRYKAGDIPLTASVSREGKTLRLDSLGLSYSVYVFTDTLQPGVRSVSMIVYADPDKEFSVAFDTLLVDRGYLPGGMMVAFLGQLFKNSDGSTHHLQGVQPDYLVDYSYEDVLTGTDPFLEKALAIIGENDTGN